MGPYQDKAIRTADGRLLAYENERTITVTKGFFLADSIALTPRLTVDLGVQGRGRAPQRAQLSAGPAIGRALRQLCRLTPGGGPRYRLDDRQQLFANVSTNFRAPDEYTLYNSL